MGYIMVNVLASDGISTSVSHQAASQTPCQSVADTGQSNARGTEPDNGFFAFVRKTPPEGQRDETNSIESKSQLAGRSAELKQATG